MNASLSAGKPGSALDAIRVFRPSVAWVRGASVAAVAVLVFAVWALRLRGPIDLRYDAGVYYILGTSLAAGEGYRLLNEPGKPEGVQYPPLLPALVAAEQRVLGTSDPTVVAPWLRWTYVGLSLAYGLAVLALARAHLSPWLALGATALSVVHINTILYSDLLFTELPYALAGVAFALLLTTRRLHQQPWPREMLTFLLAAAGFLLRSAGIALLAAWVAEAAIRRRWRLALWRALAAAVPFVAWQAHVWRVKHSDEYQHPAYAYQRAHYQFYNVTYGENMALADPFRPELGRATPGTIMKRAAFNLAILPSAIGEAVSSVNGFWRWFFLASKETNENRYSFSHQLGRAPLILLAGITAAGIAVLARRKAWALLLVLAPSVALMCSTPWPEQFARYLSPLIPFLAIAVVLGGAQLYAYWNARRGAVARGAQYGLVALAVLVGAVQAHAMQMTFWQRYHEPATRAAGAGISAPRLFYYDAPWAAWDRAVRWIAARAGDTDVVVTTAPHLCYLATGLRAVMPPLEADSERALALLDDVRATWVVIDELTFLDSSREYALPAVLSDGARWRMAHETSGTRVFERVRPGASGPQPEGGR